MATGEIDRNLCAMNASKGYEAPGIAGSGAIATGLAAVSTTTADTILLARSEASAWRAEEKVVAACAKIEGAEPSRLRVTTDPADLAECDVVVEAIVEEVGPKGELLSTVAAACPNADLATTTSSLGIGEIAAAGGIEGKLFGLHVFNPVPRMKLVEVCFPDGVGDETRQNALAWCAALGKTAVEVPDLAGFVVNRLLFPYLFDAVRFMEQTGMEAGEIDTCMKLGAGHPMGPLALLDFVGLDVCQAIGDALFAASSEDYQKPPELLVKMVGEGKLGRKSGQGFYQYD
jgi:3-hydroxybutyryl-CoA dehydrogenase